MVIYTRIPEFDGIPGIGNISNISHHNNNGHRIISEYPTTATYYIYIRDMSHLITAANPVRSYVRKKFVRSYVRRSYLLWMSFQEDGVEIVKSLDSMGLFDQSDRKAFLSVTHCHIGSFIFQTFT